MLLSSYPAPYPTSFPSSSLHPPSSSLLTSSSLLSNPCSLNPSSLPPSSFLPPSSILTTSSFFNLEKKSGKWSPAEDSLLLQIAPAYNERHWRKISQHIPGRTAIQCLHRWTKILKPGLVKGPWSNEEDEKLIFWVKTKGAVKWAQCARWIPGRSGKQCRERWFNNLNPDVKKGEWTPDEDGKIFSLYLEYGSSWSKIAGFFQDRTENSIKNRFYSTIRKLYSDQKKLEKELSGIGKKRAKKKNSKHDSLEALKKQEGDFADQKNTLYHLLKNSDVIHPEHIRKIYNSGIYRKNRRRKNNKKPANYLKFNNNNPYRRLESELPPFESEFGSNLDLDLGLSLKSNFNLGLEEVLDREIEKEILKNKGDEKNICDEINIDTLLDDEKLVKLNEKDGSEGKMKVLVQQLQTLENLLSQTRDELMNLESCFNEKNEMNFGEFGGMNKEEMEMFGVESFEIFEDLQED